MGRPSAPTAGPAVVDGDAVAGSGDAEVSGEFSGGEEQVVAAETVHAFGSRKSNDLMGYEPSLYQGKWHMPKREKLRKCISKAESRHNYRAGRGGFYRGAYQFSPALSRGVTWMMQPEVRKEMGKDGLRLIQKLRKKPMNKWNRYWQDRAFWTIWAKGTGKKHWPTRRMC